MEKSVYNPLSSGQGAMRKYRFDVFISYASEDRATVVEPLAQELRTRGIIAWFDRFELQLGDRFRQKIDEGLSQSRFGIVILSHSFFAKKWPQLELDGLATRENAEGRKVILPIRHQLRPEQVTLYSPLLGGILSTSTDNGMPAVAALITRVVTEEAAKSSGIVSTFPMIDNKRYKGRLEHEGYRVTVTSSSGTHPLTFLSKSSENGDFSWGYRGSGPLSLAGALARNVFGPYQGSLYHHQIGDRFFNPPIYQEIVTRLPPSGWELDDHEIIEVVRNSVIKDPDEYTSLSWDARHIVFDYAYKPEFHYVSAEDLTMFSISVDTEVRSYLENMLGLPETVVDIILDPFEHWDPSSISEQWRKSHPEADI
jgi:hypothetical protein